MLPFEIMMTSFPRSYRHVTFTVVPPGPRPGPSVSIPAGAAIDRERLK